MAPHLCQDQGRCHFHRIMGTVDGLIQDSSDNIVVSQANYDAMARRLYQLDDSMGDCLYQCAKRVEEMCDTVFIMPAVGPRCKHIAGGVVECLGQLRTLTDDIGISAKKFAAEIVGIG